MTTVLVTGGTGNLGREVVSRLVARRQRVRILSHRASPSVPPDVEVIAGDLVSGIGLREAVAGVDAIIHCASAPNDSPLVDVEGTRALLQAAGASGSGSPHFVYISIVGIERSSFPYYTSKRETEMIIEQEGLPWSIVRATQFHDFVLWLMRSFGADTLPVVPVAGGMRFQSIDIGEVADRLVELAGQGPVGHAPDMGGPQIRTIEEMTEAYLRIRGRKAIVRSEARASQVQPGDMFDAFRSGINLVPDHAVGTITWEAFLQRVFGQQ